MGSKLETRPLTPLELEIMKVLWKTGRSTVLEVQARLAADRRLAYTTVQTMLNVLHRKGKVRRSPKGRAYEYEPVVSRKRAVRAALRDMIDRLFGGSAESLVMSLVATRRLNAEKLDKLTRRIEQSRGDHPVKEKSRGND